MRPKSTLRIVILLLAASMLSTSIAQAATITVDTFADILNSGVSADTDGACSLREAVISANNDVSMDTCTAGSGDDTIVLGAGEYALIISGSEENSSLTGDLDIINAVTIQGASAQNTMINAGGYEGLGDRVFHIMNSTGTPDITVNIRDITITKGFPILEFIGSAIIGPGGGIYVENSATLNVEDTIIEKTEFTYYGGGGVYFNDGTASFTNTIFRDNYTDDYGGGIHIHNGTVSITNSTLTNNTGDYSGGGIHISNGTLTISNSIINSNTGSFMGGGGIHAWDGTPSIDNSFTLTINNSIINSNSSDYSGGGIYARDGEVNISKTTISENSTWYTGGGIEVDASTLNINNSTISGNYASAYGGGIYLSSSTATIVGSTVSNNTATMGGGLYTQDSNTSIGSTIFSYNKYTSDAPDCYKNGSDISSLGYNVVNTPANHPELGGECTFNATGDQLNVDPLLGPLANNGGLTMTHALLEGSPAIDAGDPACSGGTDQRGALRPADGDEDGTSTCDIGAYEAQGAFDTGGAASLLIHYLDFGKLSISDQSDSTITLTNDGTGPLEVGSVAVTDPLEAPFSIVSDSCSDQTIEVGQTCDITVQFDPSTIIAAATGIGGLGIIMLGIVLGSGVSRRRKTLAILLIGAVLAVSLLTACASESNTSDTITASDSFNIPTNDADNPNITINVSGSF